VTQRFSMEYALRPFINTHAEVVFDRLEAWSAHDHYHVRRLVSEGTRPRLPWGIGITTAPDRMLPLLDRLHEDGTRYVTRSVANHLNDLGKVMPDVVMDRLQAWARVGQQGESELAWMRQHALRSLIKTGDARAMGLLGYHRDAPVRLVEMTVDQSRVSLGEQLSFEVVLEVDVTCPVLVDYVFEFYRGAGLPPRTKVMKLGQGVVHPARPLRLSKRYRVPKAATTVKIVPGPHSVGVQVNGRVLRRVDFEVTA